MTRNIWESDKIPGIGVSQVPLILAWALTIHKSQGATMDAAEIDVGSGIFECGQTYVALSRVKSLDGLYLTSFDAKRIRINKKVKEFYESLTLYHQTNETKIKEPMNETELSEEEKYEDKKDTDEQEENIKKNTKIIKFYT
jgi:ATP-dependent DNA helicase PIF1